MNSSEKVPKKRASKRKKSSKKRYIEVMLYEGTKQIQDQYVWIYSLYSNNLAAKNLPVMDPNGLCDPFARFFVRKEVDPRIPEKHMAKSSTKYKVLNTHFNILSQD